MVTQELIDYINLQLRNGQSKEAIQTELVSKGWQLNDIESVFQSISQPQNIQQNTPSNKSKKLLFLFILFLIFLILIGGVWAFYSLKQFNVKINTSVSTVNRKQANTDKNNLTNKNNQIQSNQNFSPKQPTIPEGWQKATNLPSSSTKGIAFTYYYPPSPYTTQHTDQLTPSNSIDVISYVDPKLTNQGRSYDQVAHITSYGIDGFDTYVKNAIPFEVGTPETSDFTTSTSLKGMKIIGKSNSLGNTTYYDVILLHTGKMSDLGNEIIIKVNGTYNYSEGSGHGIYSGSSDIIDQIAKTINLQ